MNLSSDTLNVSFPQQKLMQAEKDKDWQKQSIDALIAMSEFDQGLYPQRSLLKKLYGYYNGEIDEEDYAYVLKPYGSSRRNYPAKLQNYPLIKPIVDLLLGEKRKRPLNHTVVASNSDVVTEREEAFLRQMQQVLQQHFMQQVSALGVPVPPGELPSSPPAPEEVEKEFDLSYKDRRAIQGQQALDYVIYEQEVRRKFLKAWKHYLITARVVSQRRLIGGNLSYEILDPTRVDYAKSPDVDFIEDAMWATVSMPMLLSDVVDNFYDVLTESEIKQLENPVKVSPITLSPETRKQKGRLIEVVYCEWKSMKKVFFVTYEDEFGQLAERIEEEGYSEKPEDLHVDAKWVTEVWEGYRIDGNLYKNVRPQRHLRGDLENPSEAKLSINGRTYADLNSDPLSLVMLGVPYQLKYNIYHFRLESAIARAKDVIMVFDKNLIPSDWDPEKWMYYMDAVGIAFVDYNQEGVHLNAQHQSILDMSIKVIEDFVLLLESIRTEWEWVSGVSRHRQGQMSQYDGKATSEQSIIQSSHITEDLYGLFAEFEQRDLQALLDLSKYAWIEGKHAPYLNDEGRQLWLSLDGIEHMESEYGVFVSDAAKDREKQALIEQLGQAMLQNGAPISTVVDIIDSNNFSQIKEKIQRAEENAAKLQQKMQEMEEQQAQAEIELRVEEMNREDQRRALDRQNKIDVALIQQAGGEEAPPEVEDHSAEHEKIAVDRQKANADRSFKEGQIELGREKLRIEREKLRQDARLKEKEIAVKKIAARKKPTTSK